MTARQQNEESAARKADLEFFATPDWVTDAILPSVFFQAEGSADMDVLDPCAGEGAILARVQHKGKDWHKPPIARGFELDPGRAAKAGARFPIVCADALAVDWGKPTCVVMNPPFSLTLAFAEKALREVRKGGSVAMLARLAFLESAERYDFHQAHPSDAYVFASRPGFLSSSGKTDMSAYAWFSWGPGRGNRWFPLSPSPAALEKARAKIAKKAGGA